MIPKDEEKKAFVGKPAEPAEQVAPPTSCRRVLTQRSRANQHKQWSPQEVGDYPNKKGRHLLRYGHCIGTIWYIHTQNESAIWNTRVYHDTHISSYLIKARASWPRASVSVPAFAPIGIHLRSTGPATEYTDTEDNDHKHINLSFCGIK